MQRDPKEPRATSVPAKIVPLRPGDWLATSAMLTDAERGRHYLKVTLPAIPVVVFTLTFLLGYLMGHASFGEDPTPALIGALLITMLVCILCAAIYGGFRHVAGLHR